MKYINGELRDSGNQFLMQDNNTKQITDSEKFISQKKTFKVTATF
jgi:hypothetical protein